MNKFFIKVINSIGLYTRSQCNTINMIGFSGARCTGRTTRLADAYIQLLFTTGEIFVIDHHIGSVRADLYLRDIILHRLEMEHCYAYGNIKVSGKSIRLQLGNLDSDELRRARMIDFSKMY